MPWVIATLRNQKVYARANASGELDVKGGRVEIRYRPNDGRLYQAGVRNLTVADPTPLPDETCSPADVVTRPDRAATGRAGRGAKGGGAAAAARGGAAGDADLGPELSASAVVVYTDGACSSNPGPAGLGVVVLRPGERVEISEYLGHGTNNIAELTAVLRGLEELGESPEAAIHTDSQYAIGVLQRGWKAKANTELVARVRQELRRRPGVTLRYVPGHKGVPLNERADELATGAVASRSSRRTVVPVEAKDG